MYDFICRSSQTSYLYVRPLTICKIAIVNTTGVFYSQNHATIVNNFLNIRKTD